jgi:hypothetical protein
MSVFDAILSQDDENRPFITLRTSGTPAGQQEGRSDYWSMSLDEAFNLGQELQAKAFEATVRRRPESQPTAQEVEDQLVARRERQAQIAACPTPVYHQTHRYCPSCPWTEADIVA